MQRRCASIKREDIFQAIIEERKRQNQLHPIPKFKKTDDQEIITMQNYIQTNEFLAVLIEEVGEVGKALQEGGNLAEELIQVAAVCVRWLEMRDPSE